MSEDSLKQIAILASVLCIVLRVLVYLFSGSWLSTPEKGSSYDEIMQFRVIDAVTFGIPIFTSIWILIQRLLKKRS